MFLRTYMFRNLASQVLREVLFWIGLLTGHRVPPLSKTVKGAATAIGDQVIGFEACRFVLEAVHELQRSPLPLSLV